MRSGCGSGSRRAGKLAAAALALAAAACDSLHVSPGGDFAVRVIDASPIVTAGKISVPVRVAIAGCETFRAALGTAGGSHAIELVRDGDAWIADVPVEWVRGDDGGCLVDAGAPVVRKARLDVTCADAGRTASADLELSYATADLVLDLGIGARGSGLVGSSLQYLFPSDDPVEPWALLPSTLADMADLVPGPVPAIPLAPHGGTYLSQPLYRPRLAASANAVFVTSGCWVDSVCPPLEVAPGVFTSSERILGSRLDDIGRSGFASVPGHVIDMALTAEGDLVVVSDVNGLDLASTPSWPFTTLVSRVRPGSPPDPFLPELFEGTTPPEIIGIFPHEQPMSRLSRTPDGRLAFLTYSFPVDADAPSPVTAVLNETDGHTLARTSGVADPLDIGYAWTGGFGNGSTSLAPDASRLVVNGRWLGPTGANAWVELPTDHLYFLDGDRGDATWGTHSVALWMGALNGGSLAPGYVEAFDLVPPHPRRFLYDVQPLPGSSGPTSLHGAVAVGDRFVLTTNTGVRILDEAGSVVGGSDPLPCRMTPSTVAIQSGPHHAAVGVGDSVLVFDLAASPP